MLTMFLADIEKQATCLLLIALRFISSMISSSVRAPSRSFLFPSTSSGIPARDGHYTSLCSYCLASSILLMSTESNTNIIASAPLQYFSQLSRYRGWPLKSQTFSATFPFLISLMLKPMVGIVSSSNCPVARELRSVDLPAF